MKRLLFVLIIVSFIFGCHGHIDKIKDKWGPPSKVEDRGETTAYYYYGKRRRGIVVVEFITNKDGKILTKRKYWKQPETEDVK